MNRDKLTFDPAMSVWACGLALACVVCLTEARGQGPSAPTSDRALSNMDAKTVAVLDFTMRHGNADNVENRAVGLAEFMTVALQERGVTTLERRDLRYVLSERRLRSQGIVKPDDVIRTQLPWVRYLLMGEITQGTADQFELSVSLLDAQDGHEVLRESVSGAYPTELARGLGDLADKVAGGLGKPEEPPSPSRPLRLGFTKTPEIALRFYKGLDWLIGGRPEFAEQYFRQAFDMDKTFHVARLWRMKAYRSLGLDDFAQIVQEELARDPVGKALSASLGSDTCEGNRQTVVSIVAPSGAQHRDPQLEETLARALIKEPGVRVFQPRRIHELADESDLELTGAFEDRVLPDGLILAADLLISIGSAPAAPATEPSVQMTLIDAITGEVQATGGRSCATTSSEVCCAQLFRELFARRGVDASAPQTTIGVQPPDYGPWSSISGLGYDVQQYAYYLRSFAAAPKDRYALMALFAAHRWLYRLQWRGQEEVTLQELLARRLLDLIDDQEPDAANWLSQALWILVHSRNYTLPNGLGSHIPDGLVEQTLQPLVRRHPASLAAFYALYAIAIERAAAGRHKEAAELLGRLTERLPEFGANNWPETFKANLFFFAARETDLVGEQQQARRFITAAGDEINPWTAKMRTQYNFQLFGVVHPAYGDCGWGYSGLALSQPNDTWLQTLGTGRGMDYRLLADKLHYSAETTLVQEVASLREKVFGEAGAPSLHDLFSRTQGAVGAEGVTARLDYLKNLTDLVSRGEPVHERDIHYNSMVSLQWLADLMPRDEIPRLHQMAKDLASALEAHEQVYRPDPRQRFKLYMAAAMYAEAHELADRMLLAPKEQERYFAVLAKSKVLLETDTRDRVARFLDDELRRFERDIAAPYVLHSHLTMRCAEAYRTTGQLAEAARVYQRGIDAPILYPDSEPVRQNRASLLYELARTREQEGKTDEAATLLKKVIEACDGQQWGLIRGNEILNRITLGQQAMERLERLRGKRTELTPMRGGLPAGELLDLANRKIAEGNLAQGIEFLHFVIWRIKGCRWDLAGGFNSDEDWILAARAEARLAELRVSSGP